ncbi:MAG: aminoacyl-tRNA deacylase [Desulfobulbia bacterium]
MSISLTLLEYLEWEGVDYELLHHEPAFDSLHTAEAAHIPGDQLAKCVVLEDENGYLMAVIPATHELELDTLSKQLERQLQFASEDEIEDLYEDCELGAVPPLPEAFGYDAVVDDCLTDCDDIYLEAGDHHELVHISGRDFQELTAKAPHGYFSRHI